MLHIYHSNRLEALLALLCSLRQAQPLSDSITPETVLVANPGIGRWLNLNIAERESIAANIRYVLPATFLWQVYRDCLDGVPEASVFEKGPLGLRVHALLSDEARLRDPVWQPVRRYCETQHEALADSKRTQLALRIADVFDQYLVYRPQMLLDWQAGANDLPGSSETARVDNLWQPALWRALTDGVDQPHRASLWRRFCAAAERGDIDSNRLPERLHLFNVGLLPPSTLDVLVHIARMTSDVVPERVSLYFMNPAVDYWADLVDMRRLARERLQLGRATVPLPDEQNANPLLGSLGGTGRTLLRLLAERGDWVDDEAFFLPPPGQSLLAAVQCDVLYPFDSPGSASDLHATDSEPSIQFHMHYSPLREIQALHDQLLDRFNADATLQPSDVLVMVPDINAYAPVIEAVFGSVGSGDGERARHIPWSIADRSLGDSSAVVAVVERLFDLPNFGYEASGVLAIASTPAVARRFGFDDHALSTLQLWLRESGVRRTLAGSHTALFSARDADLHSWDFALRRLLLGRAMPDDDTAVGECLPWPHVDGEQAELLGQLLDLVQALSEFQRELDSARSLAEWIDLINRLIDRFLQPDEDEADALVQLRELLGALERDGARAGFASELSHASVRDILHDRLIGAARKNHRYLTGRVTFSSMVPLRSVPFRMVCLLGMNDGAFPRQRAGLGFDLVAEYPRPGDRSTRDDDRYLFLEALLSARDELYLSWIYRSPQDNAPREPSVLVAELQDYLDERFSKVRPRRVEHPLQPFSAHVFEAGQPHQSFASEWTRLPTSSIGEAVLRTSGLEAIEPPHIDLDSLQRFWRNPSEWYCKHVLGLKMRNEDQPTADSEPFALDNLEQYTLRDWLIDAMLTDSAYSARKHHERFQRSGVLPQGVAGELVFETVEQTARALVDAIQALDSAPLPARDFTLHCGQSKLTGQLDQLARWTDGSIGHLSYRAGEAKGRDLVRLLITHLCGSASGELTGASVHVGTKGSLRLPAMASDRAAKVLQPWIALWLEGQRTAIPFFADTSPTLVKLIGKDSRKPWLGASHVGVPAESDHEAIELLYAKPAEVIQWPEALALANTLFEGVSVEEIKAVAR